MKRKRNEEPASGATEAEQKAKKAREPAEEKEDEKLVQQTRAPSHEIWVVSGTKVHAAVTRTLALLSDVTGGEKERQGLVVIKGKDKGVNKAMTIAEIVKRRHNHTLYQGNHLTFLALRTEHEEDKAKAENNDDQKKTRWHRLPLLTIALSMTPFSKEEAALYHGLQQPAPLAWPSALDSKKKKR